MKLLPVAILILVCIPAARVLAQVNTEDQSESGRRFANSVDAKEEKNGRHTEFFPNGKPQVQATYRHGRLNGPYKEFDSNGKTRVAATYRDGKLHGARRMFSEGRLEREEFWSEGELLLPRSAALLTAELKNIQSLRVKTVGERPEIYDKVRAVLNDPAAQARREAALRVLMAYRCVCGVPYRDLELDWNYIAHAEAASDVMSRLKNMTHSPENPGMSAEDFQWGSLGCGRSNINFWSAHRSAPLIDAIRRFMDDEGVSNLGHRRWCLNPAMRKTGFGDLGNNYTAMWAHDTSRTDVPDYDFVAFPAHGLTPTGMFRDHYAWSVSVNPAKYQNPDPQSVKVLVRPAVFRQRNGTLEKARTPLALDQFSVHLDPMGIPNCIVFRPAGMKVVAGASYWVEIEGLKTTADQDSAIRYLVSFVAL